MQLDAYLADINRGITIREFIEAHAPRVLANHDITARHCGLTLLEVSSAQSSSLFQLRVRDTSLPLNKNPSSSPDSSSRSRRKAHKLNSEQTMRSLSLSLSLSLCRHEKSSERALQTTATTTELDKYEDELL